MSKERLEEIKDRYMVYEYDFNLKKQDVEFLFKQAERVQELEKEIEDWRKEVKKWQRFFREESQPSLDG